MKCFFSASPANMAFKNRNSYKGKPETKRVDFMLEFKLN
jgi:hypothetical protein